MSLWCSCWAVGNVISNVVSVVGEQMFSVFPRSTMRCSCRTIRYRYSHYGVKVSEWMLSFLPKPIIRRLCCAIRNEICVRRRLWWTNVCLGACACVCVCFTTAVRLLFMLPYSEMTLAIRCPVCRTDVLIISNTDNMGLMLCYQKWILQRHFVRRHIYIFPTATHVVFLLRHLKSNLQWVNECSQSFQRRQYGVHVASTEIKFAIQRRFGWKGVSVLSKSNNMVFILSHSKWNSYYGVSMSEHMVRFFPMLTIWYARCVIKHGICVESLGWVNNYFILPTAVHTVLMLRHQEWFSHYYFTLG